MSDQSWEAEFYSVEANVPKTIKAALLHSLRKWVGYRKKNLKKHNIRMAPIHCGTSECALCQNAMKRVGSYFGRCNKCILSKTRGGTPCYETSTEYGERTDPHTRFTCSGDPEPMIAFLEKAQAEL